MSRTIDERIVSMQFDNKQFEGNVQTTLGTLDKLKQGLNLSGAAKGLETVGAAANGINMNPLSQGVETVKMSFSALQVMAATVLSDITRNAWNTGKNLVKAFTIDPIKTGLAEYETKLNSVQTILANTQSKGTNLEDVNKALNELNTYADKTIYNFTEMTRNIGTFTAAGIELDTSVTAIQGIANLAAVSGSNAQQASTAMYQLSQALASGTVKLMDWNSVVNAGMGGQVFQDALKETARAHGIAIDQLIKDEGSFRETLKSGWLTSEILTQTLSKFTMATEGLTEAEIEKNRELLRGQGYTEKQIEEIFKLGNTATDAATKVKTFTQLMDTMKEAVQSGWAQTWEIIIGDFEEAKALWTDVSNYFNEVIGKSAEARNNLLQGWADGGGREMGIEAIRNVFEGLLSILKPIKDAFREIFPPTTSQQLLDITKSIRDLTANFKLTESQSEKLKATFKGLFSIIDIVVTVIKEVVGGAISLATNLFGLTGGVLSITGAFGDWISRLRDTIKETNVFGTVIGGIVGFVQKAIDKFKEFATSVTGSIDISGWELFRNVLGGLWDVLQKIGSKVAEVASGIGEALANAFRSGDISAGLDVINGGIFAAILLGIKKFIKGLSDTLKGLSDTFDDAGGILKNVTGILDSVKDCFVAYQQSLQAKTLLTIAGAIAVLAVSLVTIAAIDPSKLSAALGGITVLFGNLLGAIAIFTKIGRIRTGVIKASTLMVSMSIAVLILSNALKNVAEIDTDKIVQSVLAVAALSGIMVGAAKLMSTGTAHVMKGAVQMIIFAGAIKILADVCKDLAALNWDQLAVGLTGVGILLAEVAGFMFLAKFGNSSISAATGILIISGAIKVLESAVKGFASINPEQIGIGLTAIGVLLGEVAAFAAVTKNSKGLISTSVGLTIIAASMKIFASAMNDFSDMSWDEIGRGLVSMGLSLGIVVIALNAVPKSTIGIATGLTIVAGSLLIIGKAVKNMSSMTWEEIAKGLTVLGLSLGTLTIALTAMTGTIAGSAALLVAAGALAILTPVITTLSKLSWEQVLIGLASLAGTLGVLGIAGTLLGPIVPSLLALGGAITLIGVGFALAGVGISAFATGIALLATSLAGGATAIMASLTVIITGIAGLIPVIIQRFGEGIVVFCKVIGSSATEIGKAITDVVLATVDVLVKCIPALVEGLYQLISGVLTAMATYAPQIVDSLLKFLIGIIDSLTANLPTLIQSAVNLLVAFFAGIVDALSGIDTSVLVKAIAGVGLLSALMLALGAITSLIPSAMAGVVGMGLLIAELALVLAAVGAFAQLPGLSWLINEGGTLLQDIGNALGGFVGGIVGGFMEGVSSSFPQIAKDLSAFMTNLQPFIDGARNLDSGLAESVKALASAILIITAADLLQGITSWITGGSSISEFGKQLVPFGKSMKQYSDSVSGVDNSAVTSSAEAAKTLSDMAKSLPNSGGLLGLFTGNNDLDAFGDKLVSFGKSLKGFSDAVSGISTENIRIASEGGKTLADMAKVIPSSGGLLGLFSGNKDIEKFGGRLKAFGKGIKDFSNSVSGVNQESILAGVNAAKSLAKLANEIPQQGGLFGLFGGNKDLEKFGSQLKKFGEAIKDFSNEVATVECAKINEAIANINKLKTTLKSFAVDGIEAFTKTLKDSQPKIGTAMTETMSGAIKTVTEKKKEFIEAGKNLMDEFVKGFKSKEQTAKTAITKSLQTIVKAVDSNKKSYYNQFHSIGKYLVDGFAAGITANTFRAEARARAMAEAAMRAARAALAVASQSKKFYEIGDYSGQGFVNALGDYEPIAYKAGSGMADSALGGLTFAVSRIKDFLDNDMESQPVIRPVLDLSDVADGAGTIGGMFRMQPAIRALSYTNAINASMNSRQNGGSGDIVSAIKDLKDILKDSSGDTYVIDGVSYEEGSAVADALRTIVRAAKIEGRS